MPATVITCAGGSSTSAGARDSTSRLRNETPNVPSHIMRLTWRLQKAIDRQEGTERVYGLFEDLADALDCAGYPGAGAWLRKIPEI